MSSRFARKMTPTFIGRKKLYKGYRCAASPRAFRCRCRSPLGAPVRRWTHTHEPTTPPAHLDAQVVRLPVVAGAHDGLRQVRGRAQDRRLRCSVE
eukprot:COSAG06_NODE_4570_length_4137_cov_1.758791_1_plen_94_part_10